VARTKVFGLPQGGKRGSASNRYIVSILVLISVSDATHPALAVQ
jgi:hypothetical protein